MKANWDLVSCFTRTWNKHIWIQQKPTGISSVASPEPETNTYEFNKSRLGSHQLLHPNLKQEHTNSMKADWDLIICKNTWFQWKLTGISLGASPEPETKTHKFNERRLGSRHPQKTHEFNESQLGSRQALHPNPKQKHMNSMKADWDLVS